MYCLETNDRTSNSSERNLPFLDVPEIVVTYEDQETP